ncbi:MAG: thioredoxin family protein [Bdellovibrionales bacterium]|nr:thioredoxin family protein [Oligoflexia bacterium]
MALLYSSHSDLGTSAPPFSLPATNGRTYTLESFRDMKGLLIVFMCNHCPYVVAVHSRLSALAREFSEDGVACLGVSSNDPNHREADSFENMIKISEQWQLPFPYAFDESQEVAKAYDAVCTPDPYLYENVNGTFLLRYRGRIDDSWKDESQVREQSLRIALRKLVDGKTQNKEQIPSMGCSIKWKKT